MAFLARHCMSLSGKRSLCELNRLRYILNDVKSNVVGNKRHICVIQSRYYGTDKNEVKKKSETEQVYYGSLTNQVRSIKVFTILSSIAGLISQPFLYSKIYDLGLSAAVITIGTIYGFFVLVSPFLVHLITKRYVTHIDHKPGTDNYIASTYTFFLRRKRIEFTPEDVKVPQIAGMFTTLIVKGHPLFLDPKMFEDLSHYSKIMGYDKPIDFSLDSDSKDQKK